MRLSRQIDEALGEMADSVGHTLFDMFEWIDAVRWRRIAATGLAIAFIVHQGLSMLTFHAQQDLRLAWDLARLDQIAAHYSR